MKAKRNHPVSVGFASIGCASVLWLVTLSSPAQQTLQVLHDHVRPAVSSGQAAPAGFLPATQHMNFSIMLPLRNQAELTRLLGRLYDPSSRDYRHFLSVAEFTEEFGPTVEDYQAVVDFARTNGLTVTDTPANRMIVPIDGTVAQIENALHVSMRVYQHPTEKRTFYSPDREPSLALSVPVWHIEGLNNFSVPRPLLTKAAAEQAIPAVTGSGPGGSYLGSDMRAAYYGGTALTGSGQIVGLWESISYDPNDVNLTFSNTGQSYSVPINNVLLDGITVGDANGDAETVLDIVQAIGMAPGLSQVRVYLGNNQVDIFNAMATENIAKQLSVSYIWEPDNYQTLDPIFEEFVAQGQTLFASSGDNGAYQPSAPQYYPAEDIYVTAAGGTSLLTDGPGGSWTSETAWQQSGGGNGPIPYVITIPVWQEGVATSSNGASTTLRNVPDVALDSDYNNYACEAGSCSGGWGGTSFSAPRWAGFMALVNEQAAAQGNPPLGFIDRALYSIGLGSNYDSDFHDITSGNNDCCGQTVAYSAVPGYDLVTGWGSPNGQALINALAGGFTLSASPGSLTVTQGSSGTTTITVADEGGFTGSVNLAVSGLPSGVTASFGANPAAESAVLTLTASSSATPGTVTITIIGTYSSLTESTTLPLTINPSSSTFTVEASPTSLYLTQGKRSVSRITVTGVGAFRSAVQLSATGLPRGVSARFSRPSVTPRGNDRATSILQFIASSKATTGAATVTVTGSSNSISASANITINLEKKRMGNVEQHWERHPPLGR